MSDSPPQPQKRKRLMKASDVTDNEEKKQPVVDRESDGTESEVSVPTVRANKHTEVMEALKKLRFQSKLANKNEIETFVESTNNTFRDLERYADPPKPDSEMTIENLSWQVEADEKRSPMRVYPLAESAATAYRVGSIMYNLHFQESAIGIDYMECLQNALFTLDSRMRDSPDWSSTLIAPRLMRDMMKHPLIRPMYTDRAIISRGIPDSVQLRFAIKTLERNQVLTGQWSVLTGSIGEVEASDNEDSSQASLESTELRKWAPRRPIRFTTWTSRGLVADYHLLFFGKSPTNPMANFIDECLKLDEYRDRKRLIDTALQKCMELKLSKVDDNKSDDESEEMSIYIDPEMFEWTTVGYTIIHLLWTNAAFRSFGIPEQVAKPTGDQFDLFLGLALFAKEMDVRSPSEPTFPELVLYAHLAVLRCLERLMKDVYPKVEDRWRRISNACFTNAGITNLNSNDWVLFPDVDYEETLEASIRGTASLDALPLFMFSGSESIGFDPITPAIHPLVANPRLSANHSLDLWFDVLKLNRVQWCYGAAKYLLSQRLTNNHTLHEAPRNSSLKTLVKVVSLLEQWHRNGCLITWLMDREVNQWSDGAKLGQLGNVNIDECRQAMEGKIRLGNDKVTRLLNSTLLSLRLTWMNLARATMNIDLVDILMTANAHSTDGLMDIGDRNIRSDGIDWTESRQLATTILSPDCYGDYLNKTLTGGATKRYPGISLWLIQQWTEHQSLLQKDVPMNMTHLRDFVKWALPIFALRRPLVWNGIDLMNHTKEKPLSFESDESDPEDADSIEDEEKKAEASEFGDAPKKKRRKKRVDDPNTPDARRFLELDASDEDDDSDEDDESEDGNEGESTGNEEDRMFMEPHEEDVDRLSDQPSLRAVETALRETQEESPLEYALMRRKLFDATDDEMAKRISEPLIALKQIQIGANAMLDSEKASILAFSYEGTRLHPVTVKMRGESDSEATTRMALKWVNGALSLDVGSLADNESDRELSLVLAFRMAQQKWQERFAEFMLNDTLNTEMRLDLQRAKSVQTLLVPDILDFDLKEKEIRTRQPPELATRKEREAFNAAKKQAIAALRTNVINTVSNAVQILMTSELMAYAGILMKALDSMNFLREQSSQFVVLPDAQRMAHLNAEQDAWEDQPPTSRSAQSPIDTYKQRMKHLFDRFQDGAIHWELKRTRTQRVARSWIAFGMNPGEWRARSQQSQKDCVRNVLCVSVFPAVRRFESFTSAALFRVTERLNVLQMLQRTPEFDIGPVKRIIDALLFVVQVIRFKHEEVRRLVRLETINSLKFVFDSDQYTFSELMRLDEKRAEFQKAFDRTVKLIQQTEEAVYSLFPDLPWDQMAFDTHCRGRITLWQDKQALSISPLALKTILFTEKDSTRGRFDSRIVTPSIAPSMSLGEFSESDFRVNGSITKNARGLLAPGFSPPSSIQTSFSTLDDVDDATSGVLANAQHFDRTVLNQEKVLTELHEEVKLLLGELRTRTPSDYNELTVSRIPNSSSDIQRGINSVFEQIDLPEISFKTRTLDTIKNLETNDQKDAIDALVDQLNGPDAEEAKYFLAQLFGSVYSVPVKWVKIDTQRGFVQKRMEIAVAKWRLDKSFPNDTAIEIAMIEPWLRQKLLEMGSNGITEANVEAVLTSLRLMPQMSGLPVFSRTAPPARDAIADWKADRDRFARLCPSIELKDDSPVTIASLFVAQKCRTLLVLIERVMDTIRHVIDTDQFTIIGMQFDACQQARNSLNRKDVRAFSQRFDGLAIVRPAVQWNSIELSNLNRFIRETRTLWSTAIYPKLVEMVESWKTPPGEIGVLYAQLCSLWNSDSITEMFLAHDVYTMPSPHESSPLDVPDELCPLVGMTVRLSVSDTIQRMIKSVDVVDTLWRQTKNEMQLAPLGPERDSLPLRIQRVGRSIAHHAIRKMMTTLGNAYRANMTWIKSARRSLEQWTITQIQQYLPTDDDLITTAEYYQRNNQYFHIQSMYFKEFLQIQERIRYMNRNSTGVKPPERTAPAPIPIVTVPVLPVMKRKRIDDPETPMDTRPGAHRSDDPLSLMLLALSLSDD